MTIVIAYNDDAALKTHLNAVERIGEEEVAGTAREVASIVGGSLLAVQNVRSAIDGLRRNKPELVFNLCEGVAGNPRWEMHFALALEMLGIPFTGCDPVAVGICGDTGRTKGVLTAAGGGTPRGFRVASGGEVPPREGTWIVKPAMEDAGIGIDASSVCSTRSAVLARCAHVLRTYRQPAVVEEFIDGRELNQSLFYGPEGIVMLPPGEIAFAEELAPSHRVVGWKAKWSEGSAEDRATENVTPARIDPALRDRLAEVCRRAAMALSIGGPCRFDVREREGELFVIDVNPNPDIGRGTGFRKALSAAGIEFADFLNELMIAARAAHAHPSRPS
ncbi:MAG: ATP-grasp domain-containing protein [Thermoanaerobaculia bacterium]